MTCENALECISAALDGELTLEDKAQFDQHLAQCDACRALYADLASLHEACGGLEVAPPPALKEQIMGNLPPQAKPAKVVSLRWKRWGAMAASLVLVAMAAWQLPHFLYTPPESGMQPASEEIAVTDMAEPVNRSAGSEDYTFNIQDSAAPTPLPDYVDGPSVNVNAAPTQKQSESVPDSAASFKITGDSAAPVEYDTYAGGETLAISYDIKTSITADAEDTNTPSILMTAASRMITTPAPEAASASGGDQSDRYATERPELHPVMSEDENVEAFFPAESVASTYCGVLTLSGGTTLNNTPIQVLESGETYYELSDSSFRALVRELTANEVDFDLRMTGEDISSSAQIGLVIVLP